MKIKGAPNNKKVPSKNNSPRKRLRELGITIGRFQPGKFNAITDIPGVQVGHSTVIQDIIDSRGKKRALRTGVTAVLPNEDKVFINRVAGGGFILNGAGELSGLTQVQEWGMIETPILLTNTLSVGTCSQAAVRYMTKRYPGIGDYQDVIIPLVGECDDSWLNDIAGQHIKREHVFEAMANAKSGPVSEGGVGGGTGMVTCDFKGGIGTSSRKLPKEYGGYTIGVLVMSNFGEMRDLRVDGYPLGKVLEKEYAHLEKRVDNYGSIISIVATDAPLSELQLNRLAKRSALGIGRVGSYAAHGSGEIILSFSTGNKIPRDPKSMTYTLTVMSETWVNPLYEAVIETTEEAILNAMCMAQDMTGVNGHFCPAVPLEQITKLVKGYY